jgi:transaldolase/glucose-6-phosphate isomerase
MSSPIRELYRQHRQSIWLDNISRRLLASGQLARWVEEDGLRGVTSNPAIFCKAITSGDEYAKDLAELVEQGRNAQEIYEALACQDIRQAAELLRPVYDQSGGKDGFVSLEVSPHLAHDTQATIEEARRLWQRVGQPNLMIKVPATPEGIPAIRTLVSEGINVNVTLLFAVETYEQVAWTWIEGLEEAQRRGRDLRRIASVASFFISRMDTLVDQRLEERSRSTSSPGEAELCRQLLGRTAIANAILAYERYLQIVASPRWQRLAAQGASPQRLLWASTSTKNPRYSPTLYVDALVAPDTVNTLPDETYLLLRSQAKPLRSLTETWPAPRDQARRVLESLSQLGISLRDVTAQLLREGIRKFCDPFDQLLGSIEDKRQTLLGPRLDRCTVEAPASLSLEAALEEWRVEGKTRQLWNKKASLWTNRDEASKLGWLDLGTQRQCSPVWQEIREAARQWQHVVVLGMGGSSLCPEVLRQILGNQEGFPRLHVLDSTVPAQVKRLEEQLELRRTLFLVSSKSGTTVETNVLMEYFLDRVGNVVGREAAGSHFAAITDPGSPLEDSARKAGFRRCYYGQPDIGGRFSALSPFGLVPGAYAGLDVGDFLDRAQRMADSCAAFVPPASNPGVHLGLVLGTLALAGRDKVTLVAPPRLASFGLWLEQLLAESLGKDGKGLVPVAGEPLGPAQCYGEDRVFVGLQLASAEDARQEELLNQLKQAGHPVIRIALADVRNLGQEFFRWEIATAVAGSLLGVNPFDQPDVEATKKATRQLTDAYEKTGSWPRPQPLLQDQVATVFADPHGCVAIGTCRSATEALQRHLDRLRARDYFAICAFLELRDDYERELQSLRQAVRDRKRVATALGYGPRYLHSTGQLHKGGPNTGVFLILTADDPADLPIPGSRLTLGALKQAQAEADFQVLCQRKRRVLHLHLGSDAGSSLQVLRASCQQC